MAAPQQPAHAELSPPRGVPPRPRRTRGRPGLCAQVAVQPAQRAAQEQERGRVPARDHDRQPRTCSEEPSEARARHQAPPEPSTHHHIADKERGSQQRQDCH